MAIAAAAAVLSVFRKPIDDLYQNAKDRSKLKLKALQTERHIRTLYKAIAAVQNVKTMWAYTKPIPLTQFYYPSRIKVGNTARRVEAISEISPDENIVIEGTAGQGKSIFLRYLCLRELSLGLRIPIFVELRRLDTGKPFADFLARAISVYGMDCDGELLDYLARSGKLVVLADGFDEIDPNAVTTVVGELEAFIGKCPSLQLVVTSRPDGGIDRSAAFHVYELAPLEPSDHEGFLKRILDSPKKTQTILKAISASPAEIRSLLSTPLLLTLLVLVYNSTNEVPATFSAFYQELFQTLLIKHDKTKPGYARKRASGLADSDLRRLFEAFCYFARQEHRLVFSATTMANILNKALSATSLNTKPEFFAQDMSKAACVMLEEGFEYHFIHKSVAEYHAAAFIAHATEEVARRFYNGMRGRDAWLTWRQELKFLSEIDRSRYLRHYVIPGVTSDLKLFGVDAKLADVPLEQWDEAKSVLNKMTIWLGKEKTPNDGEGVEDRLSFSHSGAVGEVGHDIFISLISMLVIRHRGKHSQLIVGGNPLGNLCEAWGVQAEAIELLRQLTTDAHRKLRAAEGELANERRVLELINPVESARRRLNIR